LHYSEVEGSRRSAIEHKSHSTVASDLASKSAGRVPAHDKQGIFGTMGINKYITEGQQTDSVGDSGNCAKIL